MEIQKIVNSQFEKPDFSQKGLKKLIDVPEDQGELKRQMQLIEKKRLAKQSPRPETP